MIRFFFFFLFFLLLILPGKNFGNFSVSTARTIFTIYFSVYIYIYIFFEIEIFEILSKIRAFSIVRIIIIIIRVLLILLIINIINIRYFRRLEICRTTSLTRIRLSKRYTVPISNRIASSFLQRHFSATTNKNHT